MIFEYEDELLRVVRRLGEQGTGARVLDIDHQSVALGSFVLARYNHSLSEFPHLIRDCPKIEGWVGNVLKAGGEEHLYNILWTVKQLLEK